ncbi:MAG TPA: hypothetical protein VGK16_14145 [Candidatus Limnocylindrales bacterium]
MSDLRRRSLGRWMLLELLAGAMLVAFGLFIWLSMSTVTSDPGGSPGFSPVRLAGVAGLVVGLTWMIRIFRRGPDDAASWRHRDR